MRSLLRAGRRSPLLAVVASISAAALVVAVARRYGFSANGAAWGAVMVLMVFIAWFDILERRILNAVTAPAAVAAVLLRAVFVPQALVEIALAGTIAFFGCLMLAIVAHGGFGMGDVKLAAVIGLLLGASALQALLLGAVLGGVAAVVLIAAGRSRRAAFPYGPYLAAGAAVVLLLKHPPPLV